jgi:acyl carrier protein
MVEDEVLMLLTTLFREVLGDDEITLTRETSAPDIESWDSFNHLVLMVAVEKRFGIKLRTDEVEQLQNVGDLIRVIESRGPIRL